MAFKILNLSNYLKVYSFTFCPDCKLVEVATKIKAVALYRAKVDEVCENVLCGIDS